VDGATKGSVALARRGIVTRGVLLDIPTARGVNFLDHDDSVSIADLESAEQMTGVTAKSGDLLFVRTGYRSDGSRSQDSSPGLRAECLPFLKAREPAILATDTITDAAPNQYRSIPFPVHAVCIVAMGTLIIDNCDLEALSQTCQHLGRWEFLAVVASLGLNGATGSPVNPLALF
jgi:kynurenine formamidase